MYAITIHFDVKMQKYARKKLTSESTYYKTSRYSIRIIISQM